MIDHTRDNQIHGSRNTINLRSQCALALCQVTAAEAQYLLGRIAVFLHAYA